MEARCGRSFAVAAACLGGLVGLLGDLGSPASAADPPPSGRFVLPAELAPVHLAGDFPVTIALPTGGTFPGTLTLALAPDGGLSGTLDLSGEGWTVAGRQKFRNGRGTVSLLATGPSGTLKLSGKVEGPGVLGKSVGKGGATAGKGVFSLDASAAPPLLAYLDLDAGAGTGSAEIAGVPTALSVAAKTGKKVSLAAAGGALLWKAKGPASGDGWVVSWKASGLGCKAAAKGVFLERVTTDPAAGATPFAGTHAAPGPVALPAADGGGTVEAYPGEAVAFFDPSTPSADAAAAVAGAGGSVLAKVPALGFYLCGTSVGGEAAFLTSVRAAAGVRRALLHVAPARGGASTIVIDDCDGSHGEDVIASYRDGGGLGPVCVDDGGSRPSVDQTIDVIAEQAGKHAGQPLLVNLSSYGPGDEGWKTYLETILAAVAELPASWREGLVIAVCLGNEDRDVSARLAELRQEPAFADLLDRNFLLVGATEAAYDGANRAPGDPDVAEMEDASAPDGSIGTSFATPRALALLQRVMAARNVGPRLALMAAKLAVSRNVDHVLSEAEVLEALDGILERAVVSVREKTLSFEHVIGDPPPASKTFTVRNLGVKGKTLGFEVSKFEAWVSTSPASGTVPGGGWKAVAVAVDPSGLGPGTYADVLHVFDPVDFTFDENADVAVTLVVKNPPAFAGAFATSLGSHTGGSGCQWALSVSGTLRLYPKEKAGGSVEGLGDLDGEVGIVTTYSPPYTSCSAYPFSVYGSGTISGTKSAVHVVVTDGDSFTMDFTGNWSGNTIEGPATWTQEFHEDGSIPVVKTGTIPSLVLTLE
jgi:hypothetical protein